MHDRKPEVAIFDANRVLVEVREVAPVDHVTDAKRRQMALSPNNDVRSSGMIGQYRASPHFKVLEPILSKHPRQLFFEILGFTIGRWQSMEDSLLHLYNTLTQPVNASAASEAFRSIVSFKTKLDMVNAAASTILAGALHEEWDRLSRRMGKLAGKRNKLAHGHPIYVTGPNTPNDWILQTNTDEPGLTKEEIEEFGTLFAELGVDLDDFIGKMCTRDRPKVG